MLTHQIIRISPEYGLWNAKVKEQSGIEISREIPGTAEKGVSGEDVKDHFSSCAVHEVSNITFQSSSATSVGHRVQVQWLCSRGSPTKLLRMAYRANQAFYLTSYRYSSTLM